MYRLAIVTTHPIPHQATWFRALTRVVDVEVFFCRGADRRDQAGDGYAYTVLENVSAHPDLSQFTGCDTPELADRLQKDRFDACLVTGWYLKSYVQAIRACRQQGIPVLTRGDSHLKTPRSAARMAVSHLPHRWFLNRVEAHLYVGAAHRVYLRSLGIPDSKLFFAPHFADNEFFTSSADRAWQSGDRKRLRSSLGATSQTIVMLFVGELVASQRLSDFVRALTSDRARHVIGVVIGEGDQRGELETLAADLNAPVRFFGSQHPTEMPRWYAACDAIVVPSEGETSGLVVNEAMACGLPAIVSDRVACADDLITPATGLVFPTGDVDRLSRAIGSVAEAVRVRRTEIGQAVTSMVRRYSADVACAGLLQALTAVCDNEVTACLVR
jgi:glycosyltransferase involved in cell wall biosynthesis